MTIWAIIFMSGPKKITASKKSTKAELKPLKAFAEHRHIFDFFNKTGELVNFHHHIQSELLTEYRDNKDPYYTYVSTCPVCVADFITRIYRWYDNEYLKA